MRLRTFSFLSLIAWVAASGKEPSQTLDEQLKRDNTRMIAYLDRLSDSDVGKTLHGVTLSDGSAKLKGSVFLGSVYVRSRKQHIYMFRAKDGDSAYVWIDSGGKPLPIPSVPNDNSGENAYVLSGDVYTFTEVSPGDGVIILPAATLKWFSELKVAQ